MMKETPLLVKMFPIRVLPVVTILLALSGSALGEPEEPHYAQSRPDRGPCMGQEGYTREDTWLDRTHAYLTRELCEPAVWFDGFFGEERADEEGYPGTSARLRFGVRWSEDEDFTYPNQFLISTRLPKATSKLKLVIAGRGEDDPTHILPDDPVDTGLDEQEEARQGKVELRYDVRERSHSKFSINAGLRFDWPPPPFVRARYRYTYPLNVNTLFRFIQTVFWEEEDGFGKTTRVDLDRRLSEPLLLRWSGSGTHSGISQGIDWGTELSLFHRLSERAAMTYEAGMSGYTQPETTIDEYKADVRFRRNFHRIWLFYELEPEVRWPRDVDGSFKPVWALAFRIEVQFNS
ncbi:MAG: hypothetical protein JSV26_05270 [bacterium]|nr:MAG: hypothetical protein JSV26_05270 [bacterium]